MYTFKKVKPKKLQKNYKKNYLKRDKTNNKIKKNKNYDKIVFPTIIHRWENKSVDVS